MTPEIEGGDSVQDHDFDCPELIHDFSSAVSKLIVHSSENDIATAIESTLDDFGGRSDALGG